MKMKKVKIIFLSWELSVLLNLRSVNIKCILGMFDLELLHFSLQWNIHKALHF